MKERKILYFGYFNKILTCNALTDALREKFLIFMTIITCCHNYAYCYNVSNNNYFVRVISSTNIIYSCAKND